MFTWECPTCGKELDIAVTECPNCANKSKPKKTTSPEPANAPRAPAEALPPPSRPTLPEPPRASAHWRIDRKQLSIFAGVLVISVITAVFLARPDLLPFRSGLQLEDVPEESATAVGGSAVFGDLEIAGVRTWYTDDFKPKVRAVVINHGENSQPGLWLRVALRPRQADDRVSPLATFDIRLNDELGPRESRDIETDLLALGTLQSLPPWDQLRVDAKSPE